MLKIRFEISGRVHLGSTVFKTEKETQQLDHRKKYYLRHS